MATDEIYSGRRDIRFVTVRRGGNLEDAHHRQLAVWAADCAERVLSLFEDKYPGDDRPRHAVEQARAWARGEITMTGRKTGQNYLLINLPRFPLPTSLDDACKR